MPLKHNERKCSFIGCTNSKKKKPELHLFRFPVKRPSICKQWLQNCANESLLGLNDDTLQFRVVCQNHFTDECFFSTIKNSLLKNAVPTLTSTSQDESSTEEREPTQPSTSSTRINSEIDLLVQPQPSTSSAPDSIIMKITSPNHDNQSNSPLRDRKCRKSLFETTPQYKKFRSCRNRNPTPKKTGKSKESLSKQQKGKLRCRKILQTENLEESYVTCCAQECTNTSESHILTHLPLDPERRQEWLKRINRKDLVPSNNSALCQIHFEADAWEDELGVRVLKKDVLPTLYLNGEVHKPRITLKEFGDFEDIRNNTDDERTKESSETSLYIKQEVLEPVVEVLEGTSRGMEPFDAMFMDSNIDEGNNEELVINTKIKVEPLDELEEQVMEYEILAENIKVEPLDIIDEQTVTSERCPECDEEVWDLERHIDEQHSETESTNRLTNPPKQYSNKRRKVSEPPSQIVSSSSSTQVKATTQCVLPLVSTSQLNPLVKESNPKSKQYIFLVPKTAVDKQSVILPVAGPSSAVAPSPPSTISSPLCRVDSSESFYISLARFPVSQRVGIKKKMLEVVEAVMRLKIDPEMIVIAHKAQIS